VAWLAAGVYSLMVAGEAGPWLRGLMVSAAGLFLAVQVYLVVIRAYRSWMGLSNTALDILLVTAAAWVVEGTRGPEGGALVALYGATLAGAALRYEWMPCALGGALAVLGYAASVTMSGGSTWAARELAYLLVLAGTGSVVALLAHRGGGLRRLAVTDPLTGLLNRGAFEDGLATETARCQRHGRELMLALVEVDDFDGVATRQGPARAEAVLRSVGGTLRRTVRRTDVVARSGNSEFALVFPETAAAAAIDRLEEVRGLVAAESRGGAAEDAGVTVSVGVVGWPVDGTEARGLLTAARGRLSESRRTGRVAGPPVLDPPRSGPEG
jgi:diguanylate cyclase (GGDEF)-like protein